MGPAAASNSQNVNIKDSSSPSFISIRGARTNNLKNVDVDIPLGKITCLSGPSGSGKTSLAYQTLYAESKRRFLHSLPNNIKFFHERPSRVDVDKIFPVLPVWNLPQSNPIISSRQSVLDLLNLALPLFSFFSKNAQRTCPHHHQKLLPTSVLSLVSSFVQKHPNVKKFHLLALKENFQNLEGGRMTPSRGLFSPKDKVGPFNSEHRYVELFRFSSKTVDRTFCSSLKELDYSGAFLLKPEDSSDYQSISSQEDFYRCPEPGCCYRTDSLQVPLKELQTSSGAGACPHCRGFGTVYIL